MKSKQIRKILHGVYSKFLDSIEEPEIKEILKECTFITGGCIPSMLMDEYVNDFDVYFYDDAEARGVLQYFQARKDKNQGKKFHVNLITDNSVNLSDKIQLVIKYSGSIHDVTSKFDWQHIKSYYIYSENKLVINMKTYQSVVEKELVYTGSDYPLSSMLRLRKYLRKGWTIDTKNMTAIALDIVKEFNKPVEDPEYQEVLDIMERIDGEQEIPGSENVPRVDESVMDYKVSVDQLINQLNGVDPLTIQARLQEHCGEYLSIPDIINLL